MNIQKSNKYSKGLIALALFLVLSLVLNIILIRVSTTKTSELKSEYMETISAKEAQNRELVAEISSLKELSEPNNDTEENNNELNKVDIEKQFLTVSEEFINSYLNYDNNTIEDRRTRLLAFADSKIVNRIAPEQLESESVYSSDPTFTSTISDLNIYLSQNIAEQNTRDVMAKVTYEAKGTEGNTTVSAIINLELTVNENDEVRVTNYDYLSY